MKRFLLFLVIVATLVVGCTNGCDDPTPLPSTETPTSTSAPPPTSTTTPTATVFITLTPTDRPTVTPTATITLVPVSPTSEATVTPVAVATIPLRSIVEVEPGDTLWDISGREYAGDGYLGYGAYLCWPGIHDANIVHVPIAQLIYPGQQLGVPVTCITGE